MKKILTIMLCIVTISALSACSNTSSEDEIRGEQTTDETSVDKEDLEEKEEDEEKTENEDAVTDEAVSDEAGTDGAGTDEAIADENGTDELITDDAGTDEAGSEEEKRFSMGKSEGLVYENAFIGLGCTLEEGWSFYTDEQIREINSFTADVLGEEYEELVAKAQLVYDMFAVDSKQMDNINVNLEKIDNRMLMGVNLADNYEQNLSTLESVFSSMGYTNVQAEVITITIDGEDFAGVSLSGEINGLKVYQKSIGVKCNGYLATITITTYEENNTDAIISNFYLVE